MKIIRAFALALATLLVLSACGGETAEQTEKTDETEPTEQSESGSDEPTACEEAFRQAAEVGDMQDTHEDLWPAFQSCSDLQEFTAASEKHPDTLDGADPETYAQNQCQYEPELEGSALCDALG
jgi:hypothetical protein